MAQFIMIGAATTTCHQLERAAGAQRHIMWRSTSDSSAVHLRCQVCAWSLLVWPSSCTLNWAALMPANSRSNSATRPVSSLSLWPRACAAQSNPVKQQCSGRTCWGRQYPTYGEDSMADARLQCTCNLSMLTFKHHIMRASVYSIRQHAWRLVMTFRMDQTL